MTSPEHVKVPRLMGADDATALVGSDVPALAPTVTTPAVAFDADSGEPVYAYLPLGDREAVAELRRACRTVRIAETYRAASGRRNRSRVFGWSPRRPAQRREACNSTSFAKQQPAEQAVLDQWAVRLTGMIRDLIDPTVLDRDQQAVAGVLPDWRMAGTTWTSGVVNESSQLPYHRDGFNFPTWSAMPVLRRGMDGGHLHLPEYGATLACRDGWGVFFCGFQLLHGVTPMRKTQPDGYRYSIVYYSLRGMKDCATFAEETRLARAKRTERESRIAAAARNGTTVLGVARPEPVAPDDPAGIPDGPPTRLDDYRLWHHQQVQTGDIDPVYPVLRALADEQHLDADGLAWLVLLHVAYYHLGSALAAFAAHPRPQVPGDALLRLPTGTERRGHRTPDRLRAHLLSVVDACDDAGGPANLLYADDWRALNDRLAGVAGNGRWAAYKTAEMAQKVCRAPVTVADAGHAHSTGPRKGLALLMPTPTGDGPAAVALLDKLTADLAADLGEPDIGLVETSLCDFHSLVRGRYYLGHDIDAMQEQLTRVPSDLTAAAGRARLAALPAAYLGEVGGWQGIDKARRTVYARTGQIVTR